ncbi:lectin-like protein [Reyranella sp.]|uniref:lectin-like protein n=1 Tax=Reyranella sp. TaxID=1929291 RepID=UPI003D152DB1
MATRNVPGTYATISDAVGASVAGDTILVAAGYAGNESVSVTVENLTFSAPMSVAGIVLYAADGILTINLADASAIQVYGNDLNNIISGNSGANFIDGGAGDDTLDGGDGNDTLDGNQGVNTLNGGNGNDVLYDTSGAGSTLNGGADDDLLYIVDLGGSAIGTIDGGTGTDTVRGGNLNGYAFSSVEILDANGVNGFLGTTAQLSSFGTLTDSVVAADSQFGVGIVGPGGVLDLSTRITGEHSAHVSDWDVTAGYTVTGTANGDWLQGSGYDDTLNGGDGDDTLDGGQGVDALDGGNGSDILYDTTGAGSTLNGGADNDLLYIVDLGGSAIGTVDGGTGTDTVRGSNLNGYSFSNVEVLDSNGINGFLGTTAQLSLFGTLTDSVVVVDSQFGVGIVGAGGTLDLSTRITGQHSAHVSDWGVTAGYTLTGTANGDWLQGSAYDDTLNGGDGDDTLDGGEGDDTVDGGAGNDVLNGGAGNDSLTGGGGIDTANYYDAGGGVTVSLATTAAQDTLNAGTDILSGIANLVGSGFDDQLTGDGNANRLDGGGGNDTLAGAAGADTLDGGTGADTMTGGAGDDTYYVDDVGDTTVEASNAGTDQVFSSVSYSLSGQYVENLTLTGSGDTNATGNSLANTLTGNSGNNVLSGGTGADTLYGGAGDDVLTGGAGADTIDGGGGGSDSAIYSGFGKYYELIETLVSFDQAQAMAHDLTLAGIHGRLATIFSAEENDFVTTTVAKDGVFWLGASDAASEGEWYWLDGLTQAQQFWSGGVEGTTVNGLYSNWTSGQEPNNGLGLWEEDVLLANYLGDGTWYDVDSSYSTYFVVEWDQSAVGLGFDGSDTASYAASAAAVTVNLATGVNTGGDAAGDTLISIENVTGSAHNDTLTGDDGGNVLTGLAGNDTLVGGAGNDTYYVDDVGDVVREDSTPGVDDGGTDLVNASMSYTLGAFFDNLTLTGSADINGTGNALANIITGNAGNNTLTGGDGDDTYVVDNAGDTAVEVAGGGTDLVQSSVSFTLSAEVENLTLTGSASINGIGNALANAIVGNAGNNLLDGGAGADTMTGGAGDDTYGVDNAGDTVVEAAGGGTDLVQSAVSFTLSAEVENLTLTGSTAINGTGNALANTLTGNSGNNVLNGAAGADTMDGGTGADTMTGGAGDDTYYVDDVGDSTVEASNAGTDQVFSSVSYSLSGEYVENLTLTGSGDTNATGNSLANTLTGNSGNNVLSGGTGADILLGGAGDDMLTGGAGADTIDGGSSDSAIYSGFGKYYELIETLVSFDQAQAMAHDLTLAGVSGRLATIFSAAENAFVTMTVAKGELFWLGASDAETEGEWYWLDGSTPTLQFWSGGAGGHVVNDLYVNWAPNEPNGGTGENYLIGNPPDHPTGYWNDAAAQYNVVVEWDQSAVGFGYAGSDTASYAASAAAVTVNLATGVNTGGDAQGDTLISIENVTGSANNDTLTGDGGGNVLTGLTGNDTLVGGAGNDMMFGGAGNDTYYVDDAGDVVREDSTPGVDDGGTDLVNASVSYTLGAFFENLTLTGSANTNGTGNTLANTLTGNSGNNVLDGAAGADKMTGGAGDDTYVVDNAGDTAVEASGGGTDLAQSSVTYSLAGQYIEKLTLTGSGNTNATGNSLANTLTGNSGNNALDGGTGADTMAGGAGDDTYYVNATSDSVIEVANSGTDQVFSSVSYSLSGQHIENLTLTGTGNTNVAGNSLANILVGNSGNNVLNGSTGADTMTGGAGNDTYVVDNVGDTVVEASGSAGGTDLVQSSVSFGLAGQFVENLTLTGSANINATGNSLANTLTGNSGNNALDGGSGSDVLNGGAGTDVLTGGSGLDTFVFDSALAGTIDTVADFSAANDTIRLDQSIFTAITTLGTLSAAAFFAGPAAHDADDRIVYNAVTGNLFYDSDGTGAAAAVQFAQLNGAPSISNTNFNVVA